MMSPRVSICIPAYDQVDCLRRALDSVGVQDYSDFEIIIADDSPDDAVGRLLQRYPLAKQIRYFKNSERRGSPGNWNEAVRKASGEYIKLLHHDDWFSRSDSLSRYVALLDEMPEADLAFSATRVVDDRDQSERLHIASAGQLEMLRSDPTVLFFGNFIGGPSATIYRASSVLHYDENLRWLVDVDYYIRALQRNCHVGYTEDVLIATLDHAPHRVTSECLDDPGTDVAESLYLYEKIKESIVPARRRDYVSYLDERIKRAEMISLADIRRTGYARSVPKSLVWSMMRRRVLSTLFGIPFECLRRLARKILPEAFRKRYRAAAISRQQRRIERYNFEAWEREGRPIPPPNVVKQRTVKAYARQFNVHTLIETGTFQGDMVRACRHQFENIISIELDAVLYENACERFEGTEHIEIVHGDSTKLLPKSIEAITEPCLFWLDGHYSAGITAKGDLNTPIMDELSAICEHPIDGHVILVDDARCFTGEEDYPTVDQVRDFVLSRKPDYEFEIALDIMRITPPQINKGGKDLPD